MVFHFLQRERRGGKREWQSGEKWGGKGGCAKTAVSKALLWSLLLPRESYVVSELFIVRRRNRKYSGQESSQKVVDKKWKQGLQVFSKVGMVCSTLEVSFSMLSKSQSLCRQISVGGYNICAHNDSKTCLAVLSAKVIYPALIAWGTLGYLGDLKDYS